MMNNDVHASLNYEAEYERVSCELHAMEEKNNILQDEMICRDRELQWLRGFKSAIEIIFNKNDR